MINNSSGDPGLFVSFSFHNRAIAFDLGDIYNLSSREILKISHIFISHTHMDHFAGFDRLLRIILGREKTLYLYGPEGFLGNIEGKLSGYSWNLVKKFSNQLIFHATEISEDNLISQKYICQNGFKATSEPLKQPFCHHMIHDESSLKINVSILDHGIPSLGFSLQEKFRINIRKDVLEALGLIPGAWLYRFKQAVFEKSDPESIVEVPYNKNSVTGFKKYKFRDLIDRLTILTEGQKIAYVADVAYTPSNVKKIIELAEGVDHLFIESAFLEKDIEHAMAKRHLTARQAGEIAGLAGAKHFTLFHFSPRYNDAEHLFYNEAMEAYQKNKRLD
ncbi:MAG: ribonuclease Z [Desulfobacteraceae bacterium]|nr:ribonuclease Z [Desulfobacteraceae bacterium]MBC2756922.1 ribonuclease Z [Desulfobacteraceae bacterium]